VVYLVLQQTGSRTTIQDYYAHPPLQVLRSVYLDDTGTAYIYLLNPGGGILGGDRYRITVTLQAGARAYVTTPSATKLYATPSAAAQQWIDFTLQAGAVLTYMPAQTIPFAQAAFQQHITLRLGPHAYAFLGDIVAPGRLARGEAFAYREYSSSLRVEDSHGTVRLVERLHLRPQQQTVRGLGLLEGYDYLGTFYALGDQAVFTSQVANNVHALLACRQGVVGSATTLPQGGLAVRMLAADHTRVSQALYDIWDRLCQYTLGYPAVPRRPS
jgi:urease accessory protein